MCGYYSYLIQNLEAGWKPTVRPPRLGGNERVGVFASLLTFRPNGIGMSAVEVKGITQQGNQTWIELGSVDLVDGTPIIDIKPYIPYSDSIIDAIGGFAENVAGCIASLVFSIAALIKFERHSNGQHIQAVIEQVLAQDSSPGLQEKQSG